MSSTSRTMVSYCKQARLVIGSTQISVNLFRKAGESSRFPKSPPGFIVEMITNVGLATISQFSPFSGSSRVRSLSSTEFSLSRTLSSASEISSIKSTPPCSIALTKGPFYHSNKVSFFIKRVFINSI